MNFGEAIASGFSNYVNFSSRAARSEYWYWVLFNVLAQVVTEIIDNAVIGMSVTTAIFSLAVLLPGIAVAARRLHDVDRTGWWLLLAFVPVIGLIVLVIWFCTKGTDGSNRFGPDPLPGGGQVNPRPAV
ncbi:MAG TPA: DUF805 domain-containing protein [Xanthobacteraceae bacterium]|jgi:uncharacterized membrane protein YhaH (DUF805 family)|nr:DUF805 domain-containing protein [Xanthobacteraceae bacterium]